MRRQRISKRRDPTPARLLAGALRGAAAGAAGTTALNATTYLDMAARGRAASDTPEQTVEALTDAVGLPIPGVGEQRSNRVAGLGPLTGIAAGLLSGAALGAWRAVGPHRGPVPTVVAATALAMVAGNGPMMLTGVTDPRRWRASDWLSDVVPHATFGAVTALVLRRLERAANPLPG